MLWGFSILVAHLPSTYKGLLNEKLVLMLLMFSCVELIHKKSMRRGCTLFNWINHKPEDYSSPKARWGC
jgi:hypothetical protein